MSMNEPGVVDALFRPRWGGGWLVARVAFALAALDCQLDRWWHVRDALASPNVVFNSGPAHVAERVLLIPSAAWSLWGLGFVGLAGLLYGGRFARPGLWLWVVAYAALLVTCGLNVRVPERFIVWAVVGLSLGPIGVRGLLAGRASPLGRYFLLVVYGSLYLSTGMMKALEEGAWWDGTALSYDLMDRWHAGGWFPTWLSGQPLLCAAASWTTIAFEVGFSFLVGFGRLSGWVLLAGVGMHLSIDVLMEVGPLGLMAMSLYPVLLDPEAGRRLWMRVAALWPGMAHRLESW
ncbi:MAG: hypothetical protein EXR71_14840 [Myxococcales bacterium]|nr:hypothetical protein [Myxococcales bacterium]